MTDIKITITIAGASWTMSFHDDLLPMPENLKGVPIVDLLGIKLDDLRKRTMSEIRASNVLRNAQEATQEAQEGANGAEEVSPSLSDRQGPSESK